MKNPELDALKARVEEQTEELGNRITDSNARIQHLEAEVTRITGRAPLSGYPKQAQELDEDGNPIVIPPPVLEHINEYGVGRWSDGIRTRVRSPYDGAPEELPDMTSLATRFDAVKAELDAIQKEIDTKELSPPEKEYLIGRCVQLAIEAGNIALAKMKRGDTI